jgi:hypothetical protein
VKIGNGPCRSVRSETVDTSGPSASVTSYLPRNPPLGHFENKEVPTLIYFPTSYLSEGSLDLKPSTARKDEPSMDNSESVASRNSCSRTNDCTVCQISSSQRKSDILKLHKIPRTTTNSSGLPSKSQPKSPTGAQE